VLPERRINLSGPGLQRAVQEAHRLHQQLRVVFNRDSRGRIVRIGYCLASEDGHSSDVSWFAPQEIELASEDVEEPHFGDAALNVEFTSPGKPNERMTLINVPVDNELVLLLRVLFRMHGDQVARFVIQAEVKAAGWNRGEWKPVVRYDCAHGFVHRDMLHKGGPAAKVPVEADNLVAALPLIAAELQAHLATWLRDLGYPEAATDNISHDAFAYELAKAQETLAALLDDPRLMDTTSSRAVMFSDEHVRRLADADPS
jgi:hypothetical protein